MAKKPKTYPLDWNKEVLPTPMAARNMCNGITMWGPDIYGTERSISVGHAFYTIPQARTFARAILHAAETLEEMKFAARKEK